MVDVTREQDPEVVRQVAVLLARENAKLHERLAKLAAENDELKGREANRLQQELEGLQDELNGSNSSGGHNVNHSERRRRKRRKKQPAKERSEHGPTDQPALEVQEEIFTLPYDEQVCATCGKKHVEMAGQFEESRYITVVTREFKVKVVKRQKYEPCDCPDATIITAPGPVPSKTETLGGLYSIALLCMVAVQKYRNHLPLNRQAAQFKTEGLDVKPHTLFNGLWSLCEHVSATVEALHDDVLRAKVVHMDETGWPALDAKDEVRQLWTLVSERGSYYRILDNRSSEGVATMLKGYTDWVLSDGLNIYETAQRNLGYRHTLCWAHTRRNYWKAEPDHPEATPLLDLIDEMFLIEREIDDDLAAHPELDAMAYRLEVRQQRTKPIFDKLFADAALIPVLTSTKLGQAIRYMIERKDRLKLFLEHPELPMTNNWAERELRAGVIGRKNYNGTRSPRGQVVAQNLYSIMGTALIWGIDPADYLEAVVRHERDNPGSPLLPAEYLRTREGPRPPPSHPHS